MGKEKSDQMYDVIIVGAGPSGLSAGINAARSDLKTLILEAEAVGGAAAGVSLYANYPGFPEGISAADLVERMKVQASKFGVEIKYLQEVVKLCLESKNIKVLTSKAAYNCTALVITTGTQRKKLNVPGEADFIGKGVSYCMKCDAPFFKGLRVAVVGHSDQAAGDAFFMSETAKKVSLITHDQKLEISKRLLAKLKQKANVEFVEGKVVSVVGNHVVEGLEVQLKDGHNKIEPVAGVFVSLGKAPATNFVERAGIAVDERGCVKVDRWQRTNFEGVFAAGDCTCGGMQVVTAVGEGAMASLKALGYVRQIREGVSMGRP